MAPPSPHRFSDPAVDVLCKRSPAALINFSDQHHREKAAGGGGGKRFTFITHTMSTEND